MRLSKRFVCCASLVCAGVGAVLVNPAPASAQMTTGGVIHACVRLDRDKDESLTFRLVAANEACKRNETRLQWNIVGPQGAVGERGPSGPMGPTGPQGLAGKAGDRGAVGPSGPQGPAGAAGAAGAVGPTGPQGLTGAAGATGAVGPIGSQGPAGAAGVDGPTGPQGPAGVQGGVGPAGPQGPTGAAGAIGPTGSQGAAGAIGPTGPQGPQGVQGPSGTNGTNGADGAIGPTGPQGSVGAVGSTGPQGPAGAQGAAGAVGPTGPQGTTGAAGATGATGVQGFSVRMTTVNVGAPDCSGLGGVQLNLVDASNHDTGATPQFICHGATGVQGQQGVTGPSGATGPSGTTGQAVFAVSSTSSLTTNGSCVNIPGVSQAVTVAATSDILVQVDGAVMVSSGPSTSFSAIDLFLLVDGNPSNLGVFYGFKRVYATNGGSTISSVVPWNFSRKLPSTPTLSAGSHTVAVCVQNASSIGGNVNGVVGGGGGTPMQVFMNISVLNK